MTKTDDAYALFKKHAAAFAKATTLAEFFELANLGHLMSYVGGWVESVFTTYKAGKETYRPLLYPAARTYTDLFKNAYFIPTDQHSKPPGAVFVGGNAGLCGNMGGTRSWSKNCPGIRARYGSKFYGTYVVPIPVALRNHRITSFEAISRSDGILILARMANFCGEDWVALLDRDSNIEDLFTDETREFLAKERQADQDAWGAGDERTKKTDSLPTTEQAAEKAHS